MRWLPSRLFPIHNYLNIQPYKTYAVDNATRCRPRSRREVTSCCHGLVLGVGETSYFFIETGCLLAHYYFAPSSIREASVQNIESVTFTYVHTAPAKFSRVQRTARRILCDSYEDRAVLTDRVVCLRKWHFIQWHLLPRVDCTAYQFTG